MLQRIKKYILQVWLIGPLLAILTFCVTEFLSAHPEVTESFYSQTIYPRLATILSSVSNLIPFSIDDLFYLLLLVFFLTLPVLLIRKKISWSKAGKLVINVLALVYIFFYLFWGFNYFRQNIHERLNLTNHKADTKSFLQQFEALVNTTNHSYCIVDSIDKSEIDLLIEDSYEKLAGVLNVKYPSGKRKDKGITFSSFFAQAGISGYYGPFFNEVHVNKKILPIEYPFVMAHEKAHQFGITSEAEANFYAWLVCSMSNDKRLQYSANLHILRFFLYQGYKLKEYPDIVAQLDQKVKDDFNGIRENWLKLRNEKVDKVATKVNDTYLKSNKVEEGVQDYRGVVRYIMDFKLDSTFQKKHNLSSR